MTEFFSAQPAQTESVNSWWSKWNIWQLKRKQKTLETRGKQNFSFSLYRDREAGKKERQDGTHQNSTDLKARLLHEELSPHVKGHVFKTSIINEDKKNDL